jgi:single-stranded DNA-specific DHH superfamily exonuclease
MIPKAWIADQQARFESAVARFDRAAPVWILTHNDADGLAAAALLARAFGPVGISTQVRIPGAARTPGPRLSVMSCGRTPSAG